MNRHGQAGQRGSRDRSRNRPRPWLATGLLALVALVCGTVSLRLRQVERQRDQGRRARERADVPTVSLVGYTNAGKSTMLNAMTQSEVFTEDLLT